MQLTISLPSRPEQIEFNRKRWEEIMSDRSLSSIQCRIETNAHGNIIVTSPASGGHSSRQSSILVMLQNRLGGRSLAECPVSTINGVRAVDVGWYSEARYRAVRGQLVFDIAPEICVEVISPSNTISELQEKKQLYFEAGANEVWLCNLDGSMEYFASTSPDVSSLRSDYFPEFPGQIDE